MKMKMNSSSHPVLKLDLSHDHDKNSQKLKNTTITSTKVKKPKLISFKRKKGNSKFKGVFYVKRQDKWRAQMCLGGKKKYIGSYKVEIEAALARDQKVRELFGNCKNMLNFPEVSSSVGCFRSQNSRKSYQKPNDFNWNESISEKLIVYIEEQSVSEEDIEMNRFFSSNEVNWTMDPDNTYFFYEEEKKKHKAK